MTLDPREEQKHVQDLICSSTPHVDVRAYGATGDGETNDKAAFQAANDAAEVAGGILFVPPGTYSIQADLTLGDDVRLQMVPGAICSIAPGITVTIPSPEHVEVPPRQHIWTLVGTGVVTFT